jgi:DNA-binding transcriptional MerR regulator
MTSWTLPELAARASEALAAEPGRVNGRVQEVPNERLIRWYTTIGLVDPPLSRRGRIALYGPRHLLQIVAVKRRQAAGLTIAEIQAELAGAPDTVLQQISGLDAAGAGPSLPSPGPLTRDRFWATPQNTPVAARTSDDVDPGSLPHRPAESQETGPAREEKAGFGAAQNAEEPAAADLERARRFAPELAQGVTPPALQGDLAFLPEGEVELDSRSGPRPGGSHTADFPHVHAFAAQGLRLADGVTLLLEGATFTADDLTALAAAAQPLLDEITSRRRSP